MEQNLDPAIGVLQERLRAQEEKVRSMKRLINDLCRENGSEILYPDADAASDGSVVGPIRPDTFYGQPLNTSVRRVLEMRKATGAGPASVRDIYLALAQGGFQFSSKNEKNAMDGLRISLGKASHTFHKLPNGSYGLTEWYPSVKSPRTPKASSATSAESDDTEDEEKGDDE